MTVITVLVLSILTLAGSLLIMRKIISGMSESERQLFKEKERAQITLQSIGDAVVITGALGKIEQVNQMAESLLCQSADKLIGHVLEDVIRLCKEENVKAEIRPVSRVMERQEIFVSSGDTILRRLDGTICPVEYSVAPINGPNQDLKKVAESLLKHTRKTDYVARLGGDEFCLILRFCDEAEAMVIVERIHASLSTMEFSREGQRLTIGASIGITAITDSACYDAKREGRNIVKLYQAK